MWPGDCSLQTPGLDHPFSTCLRADPEEVVSKLSVNECKIQSEKGVFRFEATKMENPNTVRVGVAATIKINSTAVVCSYLAQGCI